MTRKPAPVVRRRTSVVRGSLAAPLFGGPAPPVLSGRTSVLDMSGRLSPVPSGRSSMIGSIPGRGPPGQRASLATAIPGVIRPRTGRASMLVGVKGVQLPPVVATQTTPTVGAHESENDHATRLPPVIGQLAARGVVPLIEMSTFYAPQSEESGSDGDSISNSNHDD